MNWIALTDEQQLDELIGNTGTAPAVIFKHSTRCSISSMAKMRLEKEAAPDGVNFYYLDLLKYRAVSNKIVDVLKVHHQSPQVLLVSKGECVYEETHNGINMSELNEQVGLLKS